jgi:hypothetical protein
MKFKLLKAVITAIALVGVCVTANAGIISGTHTTDGGKVVALQNLEWMSLDYTANLSRLDIKDGFTDRYGTTWAAGEWTHASRTQAETLIGSLWGGTYEGYSYASADGAAWFMNNFGGLTYDTWEGTTRTAQTLTNEHWENIDTTNWIYGSPADCNPDKAQCSYSGHMVHADNRKYSPISALNIKTGLYERSIDTYSGSVGWFYETHGTAMGISNYNYSTSNLYQSDDYGHMLVRVTDVPEPSTLAIFVLGMVGLVSRRFKNH